MHQWLLRLQQVRLRRSLRQVQLHQWLLQLQQVQLRRSLRQVQ
ncbi:MAG: hypothetical protein ACM3ZC_01890 [Bacteroidota bacterium]